MNKNLNNVLQKGETLLWHSAAKPFPLLDSHQRNGARILLQWVAAAALTVGVLWAYTSNNEAASPKFIVAMLVVGALILLAPIREWKTLLGQQYLITDRRVLVLRGKNTVFSMPLSAMEGWRVVEDECPAPCLVFGPEIYEDIGKQLRWRAAHPKENLSSTEENGSTGLVFYSLADAPAAIALLEQLTGTKAA